MEILQNGLPSADVLAGLEPALRAKGQRLFDLLAGMGSVVVAFSGGVDSSLLCAAAKHVMGDHLLAVTVCSKIESAGDTDTAVKLAREVGFRHMLVEFNDLANPAFVANPPDRCYHCKLARFSALRGIAQDLGVAWVAEGSNVDDASDYRPGARAVAKLGIRSPLAEAGLTKADIRSLARAMSLSVWDRPSAPCLATRFPYGSPVTSQGLEQVARGEAYLREKGFRPLRVRHFGDTVRLEVAPEAIAALVALREETLNTFRELGFTYVVVDMAGYRSGSMNEALKPKGII